MELNVTNKKEVMFSMYIPPKQSIHFILGRSLEGLDFQQGLKNHEPSRQLHIQS